VLAAERRGRVAALLANVGSGVSLMARRGARAWESSPRTPGPLGHLEYRSGEAADPRDLGCGR
jgi:hypothetical protein